MDRGDRVNAACATRRRGPGRGLLRALALLGCVLALAWSPAAWATNHCTDGTFSDSFEDGTPWDTRQGPAGNVGVSDATADDGTLSMFVDGAVTLESPRIPLQNVAAASVSVWIRRGGDFSEPPGAGNDLTLQYFQQQGSQWNDLETFPGDGTDGEVFEVTHDIPPEAFHSNFRLGFDYDAGGNAGQWHIDSVCLTAFSSGDVSHFAIDHDGSAVTCDTEAITITGHNPGHQETDPGNVSVGLDAINVDTGAGEGTWSGVITGSGTLDDATAGDGAATYTFPGNGEVAVTLAFNYTDVTAATDPETVSFDVNSGQVDPNEDPDLVVSRAALRITDGAGSAIDVPDQVAGKRSDQAPGAQALGLQAVRASDADPSVCAPAFPDDSDVEVELGAECRDPATCAGRELRVSNDGATSAIATSADNGGAGAAAYTPVTLRFGADAEAAIALGYDDAGATQLHARYNPIDDGSGSPPVVEHVTGASNDFTWRPFGLDVAVPDDSGDTGATGAVMAAAGAAFEVTVSARVWQAGDDADADGVPDTGADLSDNAATPNFGQEAAPETVALAPTVADPAGGADGTLANATFDGFTDGARTRGDVAWDEVGYVDLEAALGDGEYLATGADVVGRAPMVGRFIPDHFTLDGASLALTDRAALGCAGTPGFTYFGERFDSGFTVDARATGGTVTTNYEGAFAHLDAAGELDLGATDGTSDLTTALMVTGADFAWTQGRGDIVARLVLDRDTPAGPYEPLRVGIAPADDDGVALVAGELDLDVDGDASADHAETGATDLRFGRLVIDHAAGAEIAPLELPLRAEYWNATTWQTNLRDDCTGLTLADEVELANDDDPDSPVAGNLEIDVGDGTTRITSGDITLTDGTAAATFEAPGAGNTGWVDVTALLGAGAPAHPYLRGDPEDDGSWTTDPVGRVTFGIYGGNDRRIDVRRVRAD